jgi:long-chain acyl-CoA synthetase
MIVNEHDNPLPTNTEGEIFIAGPNIMEGYYHLPKQTDQVICHLLDPATGREKRFFRSGDIGKLDDDGFLYITGRKKEMLIIAGENVFPREIEEVLNRHESVSASAVIGKNDGMRGEVPVAFVELNEDAQFDDKALRSWCRDNLAPFKAPREIRQIDQLPRNPTGKIMRRHLKL